MLSLSTITVLLNNTVTVILKVEILTVIAMFQNFRISRGRSGMWVRDRLGLVKPNFHGVGLVWFGFGLNWLESYVAFVCVAVRLSALILLLRNSYFIIVIGSVTRQISPADVSANLRSTPYSIPST